MRGRFARFARNGKRAGALQVDMRLVAFLAVTTCIPLAARADDSSILADKLSRAASGVTSFVVQMPIAEKTSMTMTFVRPMRIKYVVTAPDAVVSEAYYIDGVSYIKAPNGQWTRTSLQAAQMPATSMNLAELLASGKVRVQPLPDREESGTTWGAFAVDTPVPSTAAAGTSSSPEPTAEHSVCTYDKATYLIATCVQPTMTVHYTQYNDPANTVVLPPEAAKAHLDSSTPAPTPSSSPPASNERSMSGCYNPNALRTAGM